MALDRKGLRLALFAQLQAHLAGTIKTFRLVDVGGTTIAPALLPALVLRTHGSESGATDPFEPPEWHLRFSLTVYAQGPANETDPDGMLDDLVSSVEAALEHKPGEPAGRWWTTLGNTCLRAFPISVEVDGGELGELKIAVIGVEVAALPPTPGVP